MGFFHRNFACHPRGSVDGLALHPSCGGFGTPADHRFQQIPNFLAPFALFAIAEAGCDLRVQKPPPLGGENGESFRGTLLLHVCEPSKNPEGGRFGDPLWGTVSEENAPFSENRPTRPAFRGFRNCRCWGLLLAPQGASFGLTAEAPHAEFVRHLSRASG